MASGHGLTPTVPIIPQLTINRDQLLMLGRDPLFVGVHHLARFIGIAVMLPVIVGRMRRP